MCEAAIGEARGHREAAAAAFARAQACFAALPAPYEAAAARAARARCLLAAERTEAPNLLLVALGAYERLGAGWEGTRIRAELRRHGISLPKTWRGGRRPYGDELSPREIEIARLAGTGHKNREIAEALLLSPRTVETHVAAALRKLGVGSREALTDAIAERARRSVSERQQRPVPPTD